MKERAQCTDREGALRELAHISREFHAIETCVACERRTELIVRRTINGPARLVFDAFTKPELLKRWWVPKSTGIALLSCEADVRVGGT